MTHLESFLTLNSIYELGSIRIKKLLDAFGSAENILSSSINELCKVEGISKTVAQNIVKAKTKLDIEKEMSLVKKNQVKIVTIQDKDYPENLKTIYDPPPVLYLKGNLSPEDALSLAIVGSRRASFYGLSIAEKLAYELAHLGITIVSGMARGIDSAAHRGALKAKGRTIAVLGSGLTCIYPSENKDLFKQISESGAVVSEFPMITKPLAHNFPRRNRIISGLSLGVVVVEAPRNSGALITADCALEQGREVFAIPGKIDSLTSFGTNRLIKQGAKLVENIEDIIEEFKPRLRDYFKQKPKVTRSQEIIRDGLSNDENKMLQLIDKDAKYIDDLSQEINLSLDKVMSILTNLEMKHLVKQLPGKLFVREC